MSSNYFRLPRHTDLYRRLSKIYPCEDLQYLSALEQLEYWLADCNDKGFEYEVKNGDNKTKQKRDYPYLVKTNG